MKKSKKLRNGYGAMAAKWLGNAIKIIFSVFLKVFFFGFAMLTLEKSWWPTIATDLAGIYDVTTSFVRVVNKAGTYLRVLTQWMKNTISASGLWLAENYNGSDEAFQHFVKVVEVIFYKSIKMVLLGLFGIVKYIFTVSIIVIVLYICAFFSYGYFEWLKAGKKQPIQTYFLKLWSENVYPMLRILWKKVRKLISVVRKSIANTSGA